VQARSLSQTLPGSRSGQDQLETSFMGGLLVADERSRALPDPSDPIEKPNFADTHPTQAQHD